MAIRGTDGDDHLFGTELADLMNGFGGNDEMFGNGGNDNMHGDAGNDIMDGGEGNDVLDGGLQEGSDSDFLDGGNGLDAATYSQVQHSMTVDLSLGQAFDTASANIDTLVSIENVTGSNFADKLFGNGAANGLQGADGSDSIEGRGGADRLSGNSGNDTLNGGAGADTLIGSTGVDKLIGRDGADTFQYSAAPTLTSPGDTGVGLGKRDVVTDFQHGVDKLDLHNVDAQTSVGHLGNQDFSFIGGGAFSAEGQVRVFTEGNNTIVQASNDGDLLPDFEVQLTGLVTVSAGDFVL